VSGVGAVILAAGLSTRMGRPKPMLVWRGRTLLSRAVDAALAGGFEPVAAVINDSPEPAAELAREFPHVHAVVNPDAARGIGTSIRRGIAALQVVDPNIAASAILLADQPLITGATLSELLLHYRTAGKLVIASDFGGAIGPPLIVSGALFEKLLALPDDRGAAAIWKQNPDWVGHFSCPDAAADVDTQEDFEKLGG